MNKLKKDVIIEDALSNILCLNYFINDNYFKINIKGLIMNLLIIIILYIISSAILMIKIK